MFFIYASTIAVGAFCMSALKSLLALKSKTYGQGASIAPRTHANRAPGRTPDLLAPLLSEFYNSAKLTIAFTSIVNARSRRVKLANIGRPSAFLPGDPMLFPGVAAGLATDIRSSAPVCALHDFYMRLAFARMASISASAALDDGSNSGGRELAQLTDVWQRLCAQAAIVLHHAYDVEPLDEPARKFQIMSIQQAIKSAQAGEHPYVRADGTLFVPGWLEERREHRHAAGWKIVIDCGDGREPAVLLDISSGGVGLGFCKARSAGTQISVEPGDGRCFAAIVTWSNGDRMGARFIAPLTRSDPLFAAAAVASSAIPN
jgi:hypothetical protein